MGGVVEREQLVVAAVAGSTDLAERLAASSRTGLDLRRGARAGVETLVLLHREAADASHLASLGRLMADLAHRVNNPLAVIRSNVSYLRGGLDGDQVTAELPEVFEELDASIERIRVAMTELAVLWPGKARGAATCDAALAVEAAVHLARLHGRGGVTIDAACQGPLDVEMRHDHLVQVLVNLLFNAVEAVESRARDGAGRVRVEVSSTSDRVRLAVGDDGPGFTPEARAHLCEPFFSTKPGSSGLGLALCRDYLAECGAALEVAPGAGACVSFELPRTPAPLLDPHLDRASHGGLPASSR
jgi:signal transduction histidine kinase